MLVITKCIPHHVVGRLTGDKSMQKLTEVEISATVFEGIKVTGKDGKLLRIAIIDDDKNIVNEGSELAKNIWNLILEVQKNFWVGKGHIRVLAGPPVKAQADLMKAA